MSALNYLRLFGYVSSISLHGANIYSLVNVNFDINNDDIKKFHSLQYRYFTCWTFFLQMCHAFVGIYCEKLSLSNRKNNNYKLPKYLRGFRDTLFSAILFPSTFLVVIVFWSLYSYDRSFIFPDFIDLVLTPTNNHIMHTCIIPLTLWEVIFQPRMVPKSHIRNLAHLTFHMALYLIVLCYTYNERGFWIYPILGLLYDINMLPVAFALMFVMAVSMYYLQWPLVKFIWGNVYFEKKKN